MTHLTRRQLLKGALVTASAALVTPRWAEAKSRPVHPFRLASELRQRAQRSGLPVLNAGTGTPNFMHVAARENHSHLYQAALALSRGSGLRPDKKGLGDGLRRACTDPQASQVLKLVYQDEDQDEAADQLLQMLLGNTYSGFLPLAERSAQRYLSDLFKIQGQDFRLIPSKGASEALKLLFADLKQENILGRGDRLAEMVPTFSPFLFSPELKGEFAVESVRLHPQDGRWKLSEGELRKLADPRIKALYLVDPGNPLPGALSKTDVDRLVQVVRRDNPELLILADLVYAAFPGECHPLIRELPENTIGICSWSKHFGATGWRLGAMLVPKNLSLAKTLKSPGMTLPQQAALTIFSLTQVTEQGAAHDRHLKAMLRARWEALHEGLELDPSNDPTLTHFFALVDLHGLANRKLRKLRGEELDYFYRLADLGAICLPGSGFSAPEWTARVSLASLTTRQCRQVGTAMLKAL